MLKNLLLTCLLFTSVAVAQSDFSNVQINVVPVGGNVYMFEGAGGNIGVSAGEDGLLMIDDQFAPLAEKINKALNDLNSGKLRFLLNTHVHGDHVGGNSFFSKDATIIAHENIRKRMVDRYNASEDKADVQGKEGWPVITFEQSVTIHFNGEEVRAHHLPHGHTDGDAVIEFTQSKVFHVGDLLFNGMFPFIDLDNGGDVAGYIKNVEYLLEEIPDDYKIIAGHGKLADKNDLKSFHEMLVETTTFIKEHMSTGKTGEEIINSGLEDKWKNWSWSFVPEERWIETVYNSFSK